MVLRWTFLPISLGTYYFLMLHFWKWKILGNQVYVELTCHPPALQSKHAFAAKHWISKGNATEYFHLHPLISPTLSRAWLLRKIFFSSLLVPWQFLRCEKESKSENKCYFWGKATLQMNFYCLAHSHVFPSPWGWELFFFFLPHSTCGRVITQYSETHTNPSVRGVKQISWVMQF